MHFIYVLAEDEEVGAEMRCFLVKQHYWPTDKTDVK